MKALITGSTGFIGRQLATMLVERGDSVRGLLRPQSRSFALPAGVEPVVVDNWDPRELSAALEDREVVFHLGAAIHAPDIAAYRRANVIPTRRLLEACARRMPRLHRFVYVSSIAAAGPSPPDRPRDEADPETPVSLYGRSKLEAEREVHGYMDRLPAVIIRPPNVIGPGQRELETLLSLLQRRFLPLIGNGRPQTSLCHVKDVARALILAAEHDDAPGRTYFVSDGISHSWRRLLRDLARELHQRPLMIPLPHQLLMAVAHGSRLVSVATGRAPLVSLDMLRSARRRYWLCSSRRISRELGFTPGVDVATAIRDVVAAYRGRRSRE